MERSAGADTCPAFRGLSTPCLALVSHAPLRGTWGRLWALLVPTTAAAFLHWLLGASAPGTEFPVTMSGSSSCLP